MNLYALIPLVAILVSAAFGAVSLAWNSGRRSTRSMAALFACTFVWGVLELLAALEPTPSAAMRWLRWVHLPPLMTGPVVIWIVVETLPQARSEALFRRTGLAGLATLVVGAAAGLESGMIESLEPNGYGGWIPTWSPLAMALMPAGVVLPAYGARVASRTRSRAGQQRSDRRRAWGLGIAVALSAGIAMPTEMLLPMLGSGFPRLGCVGVAVAAAAVWLSVLHENEALLMTPQGVARELLERLQDGVALMQLDGTILSCNARFGELARADAAVSDPDRVGVAGTGLLGVSLATLVDAPLERIRLGIEDRECTLRPRRGDPIPISLSSSVARSRTGAEIGCVVVVRDLREVDALRSHLLASGRRAAIGELAAGIAHEVNNPVAFMRSDLNLMRERVTEVRARLLETTFGSDGLAPLDRSIARIDRALEGLGRVTEVVVDVRDFAHVGGAGQGGSDPLAVVEGAMRLARLERDAEVTLAIDDAQAPTRIARGQELKQALLVVLRLLAGATEKGGHVGATIRLEAPDLEIVLRATPLRESPEVLVDRFAALAVARPDRDGDLAWVVAAELIESLDGRVQARAAGEHGFALQLVVPLDRAEATP